MNPFKNFAFPWFSLLALIVLAWLVAGCSTVYKIERCEAEVCIRAEIKSRREFSDGLALKYNRETGNFEFSANQVTTHVSPLEQAAADIIRALPQLTAPQVPE